MRNLKRVLSLALASIMLLGMMVVGAGAASKDFTDADEIKNVEAVDVMVALGILEGGDKGDFQPNSILTREQAAKIICYLLLGEEAAEKLTTNYSIFSDVPANRWSAPYISYCVNLGILAGDGAGHFYPEGKLTGVAFAKMLLVSLGYSAERENYVGNNWEINVSAAAIATGVAPKGLVLSNELSRQDAAQMAFNTLSATMVEYLNDNTIIIGDTTVSTVGKASAVAQAPYTDTLGIKNLQFAEKQFSSLKKSSNTDAFGRPAHTWVYDKKEVGTYVDADLLVESFTDSVTGKEMYNTLTASIIKECDLTVYVDGYKVTDLGEELLVKANNRNLPHTDTGVLTEVYVDSDAGEITIAVINTYLAIAQADYNEKTDKVTFDVYSYDDAANVHAMDTDAVSGMPVKGEDFAIEDVKEGDIVLVNVAGNAIEIISKPETVNSTKLKAFSKGSKVVADGTTYPYAASAQYDDSVLDKYDDQNLAEALYNLYLDPYGNLIGIELVEDANTYVFITGYDMTNSNTAITPATASAIFTDGSMKTIKVNVEDSTFKSSSDKWAAGDTTAAKLENTWYSYKVNSNDVYTLTYVADQAQTKYSTSHGNQRIDRANIALNGVDGTAATDALSTVVYSNSDTQFITVGLKYLNNVGIINKVKAVNTGIKNTDLTVFSNGNAKTSTNPAVTSPDYASGVYALYDSEGYVIAAVVVGKTTSSSENLFYALGDVNYEEYNDGKYYWSVKGIMNGEEATVRERGDWGDLKVLANVKKGDLFTLGFDSEGYVVEKTTVAAQNVNGAPADGTVNQALTNAYLHVEGWTLFLTQGATDGIVVADECPTALVEKIDGKTVVTYYKDVKAAVKAMQDNTGVNGKLIATLDGKKNATSLIIVDDDAQGFVPPVASNDGTVTGTVKLTGLTLNVYKRAGESLDVLAAAENYFGKDVVSNIRANGLEYDLTVGNKVYTTNTVTLQPITLTTTSGAIAPSTVYLAKGESVVVTITSGGNWSQGNANSLASNSPNGTISDVSGVGTKTISFHLNAGADYTVAKTINISWS